MSRTKNTIRNSIWGVIQNIVNLLLPFIIRTVILRILGTEYLGITSLFSSILNVLNLAELGFSSAVVFSMYEPIGRDDSDTICALLAFYRKVYLVIGTVVLVSGLCVMPFLSIFVKGECPADMNLYILFAIYLFNSFISYFLFGYKEALLSAHHRTDLLSKVAIGVKILQYGVQIAVLLIFKNYYVYIILLPICTIINNLLVNSITRKHYPEYVCNGILEKDIKKKITNQVKGVMVSKVCGTLRNSLDSIVISSFIGLTMVAIYDNYYYILTAVHGMLTIIGTSMKAGVGNSIVKESKEKNFNDYNKFSFLYAWLSGWFACCMVCLYQPFMLLWTRKAEMLFSTTMMLLFCVYFFFVCMMDIRNVYMDAIGLWWESRYRSIAECVGNLVLNLLFVKWFGVIGILIATLITLISINILYGTKILFDNYFTDQSVAKNYLKILKQFMITAVATGICYLVCSYFGNAGVLTLILRGVVCVILPNLIFLVCYQKDSDFILAKQFLKSLIKRG